MSHSTRVTSSTSASSSSTASTPRRPRHASVNPTLAYSQSIHRLTARDPPITEKWIMQHHDLWSRLTLSSFYQDLADHILTPTQFTRWLLDRAAIAIALVKAATRIDQALQSTPASPLQLLTVAKDDANFIYDYALKQGFDLSATFHLSYPAQRLIDLLDLSTAPDAPLHVALTAVWAYMLSSWSGWALCKERRRDIPIHFQSLAHFISRHQAVNCLVETQRRIDQILANASQPSDVEKGCKTFEEVVKRACAVLDNTLYIGEANKIPLCRCGRKGHLESQCTFKSHI